MRTRVIAFAAEVKHRPHGPNDAPAVLCQRCNTPLYATEDNFHWETRMVEGEDRALLHIKWFECPQCRYRTLVGHYDLQSGEKDHHTAGERTAAGVVDV